MRDGDLGGWVDGVEGDGGGGAADGRAGGGAVVEEGGRDEVFPGDDGDVLQQRGAEVEEELDGGAAFGFGARVDGVDEER